MATLINGTQYEVWANHPRYIYLTGDVTRSNNTVTLSNLRFYFKAERASASGYKETLYIRDGTNNLSSTAITWSFSGGTSTTVSLNNASFTVGTTDTSKTLNLKSSDESTQCNFTVSFPSGATAPSGLSVTLSSRTWQSANILVNYSSLGSGAFRCTEAKVFTSDSTGYYPTEGTCKERWEQYSDAAGAHTFTINNSDSTGSGGGIDIKGCTAFKIGGGVFSTHGDQRAILSTVYYTPPAPLQSITQTNALNSSGTIMNSVTITGGTSTNNNSVTVTTQYHYLSNGGSYTDWASAGTGTPWTAKTATFNTLGGSAVTVQARQVYQSQYSETKTLSYTVKPVPPVLTLTKGKQVNFQVPITIKVSGNANNISANGVLRYCIYEHGVPYQTGGAGALVGWTELGIANIKTGSLTTTFNGAVGQKYDVYADISYASQYASNAAASISLEDTSNTGLMYYSPNGNTSPVTRWLGPGSDGASHHIQLIYGSANGMTKLMFVDYAPATVAPEYQFILDTDKLNGDKKLG